MNAKEKKEYIDWDIAEANKSLDRKKDYHEMLKEYSARGENACPFASSLKQYRAQTSADSAEYLDRENRGITSHPSSAICFRG